MRHDPLPTDAQKAQLADLIQRSFVEIRSIAGNGRGEQAANLADTMHNLPREMHGWGTWNRKITRGALKDYQDQYHGQDYSPKFDYVAAFDAVFAEE
ncbi:MAG: hypothetical protein ACI841_002872 [Planctomycetota bacterium]|jgi:hypothetical protein